MTCLEGDQPYLCIYKVQNGQIITVCDNQCDSCKNAESFRPGIYGSSFKVDLHEDFHSPQETIVQVKRGSSCKVIGDVTHHNYRWYHRIINFVSFGLLYDEYYEHEVKIEENERRVKK
jgi:hypothetical protein